MPTWIPVDQQLPPALKPVWVAVKHHRMTTTTRAYYVPHNTIIASGDDEAANYDQTTDEHYVTEGWYESMIQEDDINRKLDGAVSHWMSLPDLPKDTPNQAPPARPTSTIEWISPEQQRPDIPIPVIAYWQEDGVWITQYYSPQMSMFSGEIVPQTGWHTTVDDSWRPDPVCWCYPPTPPGKVCDLEKEMQP